MSFLIDPPWLYANGQILGRLAPEEGPSPATKALGAATLGTFLGVSIPLYLNHRWTKPLWKACRAESGRDWMLNSGVFEFDHKRPSTRTNAIAALIFATYPLWLILGYSRGRRRRL